MYKISFLKQVKKDLKKLDKKIIQLIQLTVIPAIKENPKEANKLKEQLNGFYSYHFRYSKTDYRIVYTVNDTELQVLIYKIGTRENFYKDIPNRFK